MNRVMALLTDSNHTFAGAAYTPAERGVLCDLITTLFHLHASFHYEVFTTFESARVSHHVRQLWWEEISGEPSFRIDQCYLLYYLVDGLWSPDWRMKKKIVTLWSKVKLDASTRMRFRSVPH